MDTSQLPIFQKRLMKNYEQTEEKSFLVWAPRQAIILVSGTAITFIYIGDDTTWKTAIKTDQEKDKYLAKVKNFNHLSLNAESNIDAFTLTA